MLSLLSLLCTIDQRLCYSGAPPQSLRQRASAPCSRCAVDTSLGPAAGLVPVLRQLERPTVITSVDIGNYGSAFVEVLARNSEWDKDRPYCPLVPMSTLMSPSESREWTNVQGVTMFCAFRGCGGAVVGPG